MKKELLILNCIKLLILIPLTGYLLILIMITGYAFHTGSFLPHNDFGYSNFCVLSPFVMYVSVILNLISVCSGITLNIVYICTKKKVNYTFVVVQLIEVILLLWLFCGRIKETPILWILFD